MKTKQLLIASILIFGASTFFTSCSKDSTTDPVAPIVTPPAASNQVVITGNITSSTSWTKDKVYILNGRVFVTTGTLTIQAGTVIKGRAGIGSNTSALIIARGAKIDAQGTATEPIIFTAEADAIVSGQIESPNLDPTQGGMWGGVVLLGYAPVSDLAGGANGQLEGIPASVVEGVYGGSDAADNSGILKYVSIRHGGTVYQPGKELNGLTLCGVGNGTEINHIEIISTLDDGIEFFGGSVNVTDVICYKGGDDGLDIDQSYSGTISNFVIFQSSGQGCDKAFEIDGPENAINPSGKFTITNGYVVSDGVNPYYANFKEGAQGTLKNVYFTGFPTPTASQGILLAAGITQTHYDNNDLIIENNIFNTSLTIADITDGTVNDVKMAANNTVGVSSNGYFTASQFTGWSLVATKGWLTGLN